MRASSTSRDGSEGPQLRILQRSFELPPPIFAGFRRSLPMALLTPAAFD